MRLSLLFTSCALLSLASCAGTKSEEEENGPPLPPPVAQPANEEPKDEPKTKPAAQLPKLEEPDPDLSKVGEWSRRSPVKNLPSQSDLVPSLAPLAEPSRRTSQATKKNQPVVVQP